MLEEEVSEREKDTEASVTMSSPRWGGDRIGICFVKQGCFSGTNAATTSGAL